MLMTVFCQVGTGCSTDWLTIPCATNTNDPFAQNGTPVVCVDRSLLFSMTTHDFEHSTIKPISNRAPSLTTITQNIQEMSTQAMWDGVQLSPDLSGLRQCASLQFLQAVQHLRAHRQSWRQLQPSRVLEPRILPQLCSTAMYLILWIVSFYFLWYYVHE